MKKQHLLWAVAAIVLWITMLLPFALYRGQNDQNQRYYTAAVDLAGYARDLPKEKLIPLMKEFRAVGVEAALIREQEGGYSEELLQTAKKCGFKIVLQPDVRSASYEQLERIIEENQVEALKLQDNSWSEEPETAEKRAEICRLIRDRKMILVLTETLQQLSNYHPDGFEEYLSAAEGRILRCCSNNYYAPSEPRDYPYNYYHYLNAVLDRNIRFLLAESLTDAAFTPEENTERMIDSMARLCEKLEKEGYSATPSPDLSAYPPKRTIPAAAAMGMIVLMSGAILELLQKRGKKWILFGAPIGAAVAFFATLLLPESILFFYPTGFAAVAPCFCFAMVYEFLKARREKDSLARLLLLGCLLSLGLLLFLGSSVASMINGWDYWINEKIFRGVKFSLMMPLIFSLCWMFISAWADWRPHSAREALQMIRKGLRWYHGLLLLIALGLIGFYLIRSGNVKTISFLETRLRDGLTEHLLARPRTKEFLLGWPALMLLIFEMHFGKRENIFRWLLGGVSAVLFASVVNTFCHVFTPVEAMVMRTIYGLIIGCAFGGLLLLLAMAIFKKKR